MSASEKADQVATRWQLLRQFPTDGQLWLDLARAYAGYGLLWQAGYSARQALRCDAALAPDLQELNSGASRDAAGAEALLGRAAMPEAATMAQQFRGQVTACPGDWLTWLYLARLLEMVSQQDAAQQPASAVRPPPQQAALQQAQSLEPFAGESLHWMGVWRLNAGDADGAAAALSRLLDIRPVRTGSMMYLGDALLRMGNTAAAEKAYARASLSNNTDFLLTLSARVYACNYWQEAIAILRKALTLKPDSVPIWLALARIQSEVYFLADCRESLRQIRILEPNNLQASLLEAGLQGRMGDARGHLATLQAAYESGGDPLSRLASSIAMTSLYHDALSADDVARLHRSLCQPIEAAVTHERPFDHPKAWQPGNRRLRVGYVTGDFHRQHPVNIFMLPLLLRHDRSRFEICVYHTGTLHDEYTRKAQACADRWMEAAALDDATINQAIVDDGIDILVDLAGHTASHRLGVFAMRAAPVQATFLGYPHSTGLSTIDWLIGDTTVSPAEHAHLFSERIAQLPKSVFCWSPMEAYALPPPRPPDSPFVFGSFNNAMKLSPRTISLWAQVMKAVPDSKLLLKAPSLRDSTVQAHFATLFGAQGINADRLVFRGPTGLAQMMWEYGDMDIALDPTPYNGGTTTLQALWMGVPVVTLAGGNFVSRMGASFMRTLGEPNWVAKDETSYVEAALQLARNRASIRLGRKRLREKMAASALCDIRAYTSHYEALLTRMWLAYCDGDTRHMLTVMDDGPPECNSRAHTPGRHLRSRHTVTNPVIALD